MTEFSDVEDQVIDSDIKYSMLYLQYIYVTMVTVNQEILRKRH